MANKSNQNKYSSLKQLTEGGEKILGLPDFHDLSDRLKFSPQDGRIWLDDIRMMMLHATSMGALRTELIESLGVNKARALLTRMGYVSGAQDAELATKLRPTADFYDVFSVGPQLHALEGIVLVEPVKLEVDVSKGKFYGEFLWHDSIEDEMGTPPFLWEDQSSIKRLNVELLVMRIVASLESPLKTGMLLLKNWHSCSHTLLQMLII
jgi:hypothetical protein